MCPMPLTEFADRLNEVIPDIARELARRQQNELFKGKITLPQLFVLEYLLRNGEAKMTDLARCIHVTTAAMTGIVDRLVRDGYLLRVAFPKDRRIVRIKVTSRGASLVSKLHQQRREMLIKTFSTISESDRSDYLRVLVQIRDNLVNNKDST